MPDTFVIDQMGILLPSRAATELWKEVERIHRLQKTGAKIIQITLEAHDGEIWLDSIGVKPGEAKKDEVPF